MFKKIVQIALLALTLATVIGSATPSLQDVPEPGCFPCSR